MIKILFSLVLLLCNILITNTYAVERTVPWVESLEGKAAEYLIPGNLGIGTTLTSQKLHVDGVAYFSSNIGIGTKDPISKLTIYGDTLGLAENAVSATLFNNIITSNVPDAYGGVIGFDNQSTIDGDAISFNSNAFNSNTIDGTLYGLTSIINDSGTVLGDVYGLYVDVATTSSKGYGVYLNENSLLKYALYSELQAPSVFSGNVGIGSSSPVALLQVGNNPTISLEQSPAAAIKGNLVVDGKLYGDGSALTGISTSASQWSGTAGSDIYYSLANVGIGTSTSKAKLDVEGDIYTHGNIGINSVSPSAALDLSTGGIRLGGITRTSWPTNSQWTTSGSSIYYNSGNVAIGTTRTTTRLTVNDTLQVSGGNISPTAGAGLELAGGAGFGAITAYSRDSSVRIPLALDGSTVSLIGGGNTSVFVSSNGGVALGTSYGARDAGANNMVIGGCIGIGTYTPVATLDVRGTISNTSTATFGGNVGINSASPGQKLDVNGSIYATGNIGIGSANPIAKLHIGTNPTIPTNSNPVIAAKGNLVIDGKLYGDGSALTGIASGASQWSGTAGSYIYYNSANVGIGSSTPTQALDVVGNITVSGSVITRGSNTSIIDKGLYINGNVGIGTSSTAHMLEVNGTTYLHNNVGIGTTAPRAKLDVEESVYINGATTINGELFTTGAFTSSATGQSQTNGNLYVNGNIGIGSSSPVAALDMGSGGIRLGGVTQTSWPAGGSSQWSGTVGSDIYYTSGNVGIGSAVPADKLDVEGAVYINGNVGIGGINPSQALEIKGTQPRIRLWGAAAPSGSPKYAELHIDDWGELMITGTTTIFNPYTDVKLNNDKYIRLGDLSNYGFGYYSGGNKLQLVDFSSGAPGTAYMVVDSTGNIGIGSENPSQKLDVSGSVRATGGLYGGGENIVFNGLSNTNIPMADSAGKLVNTHIAEGSFDGRPIVYIGSGGDTYIPSSGTEVILRTSGTDALFGLHDSGHGVMVFGFDDSETAAVLAVDGGKPIRFITTMNGGSGGDNLAGVTPQMVITGAGNVGIGTTTPVEKIQVDGNASINNIASTSQVTIGGTQPGCLMIRDSDGAGWTQITVLDGVISVTSDADGVCN